MNDRQRTVTSKRAHRFRCIESLNDPATTADEFIVLLRYYVLALDQTQHRTRRVLQGVIRVRAGVQAGFADGYVAVMRQPFAIRRDGATVAQGVANEVICKGHANTPSA